MDNCICSEWDDKGWSVCGVPCPEHNKLSKEEQMAEMEKTAKAIEQFIKDIKAGKIKKQELDF